MKCCICKNKITGTSHGAHPVKKGRCCDSCNDGVVLPIRRGVTVMQMFRDLYKLKLRKEE